MNAGLKGRLQSFFLDNGPKVRNRQSRFLEIRPVKWRCKSLLDRVCLNDLRAKDIR